MAARPGSRLAPTAVEQPASSRWPMSRPPVNGWWPSLEWIPPWMVCAWITVCAVPENPLRTVGSPIMRPPYASPGTWWLRRHAGVQPGGGARSDAPCGSSPPRPGLVARDGCRAG